MVVDYTTSKLNKFEILLTKERYLKMSITKDVFLQCTKRQLLFSTINRTLTIYDLWNLSISSLKDAGREIYQEILKLGGESELPDFLSNSAVTRKSKQLIDSEIKLKVIEKIINIKEAENKAREEATFKKHLAKKRYEALLEAKEQKEIGEISELEMKDIEKELEDLRKEL